MDKQQAITEAARAVLEHGGPACLTDPRIPMTAMGRAYDLGATETDITDEMKRQRGA